MAADQASQGPALNAGVEGETRNLTPKIAFYIGTGLAKLLAERFNKPAKQLHVSVSCCSNSFQGT